MCVIQMYSILQLNTIGHKTLTHSRRIVQDPHAISLNECFSAELDVSDVPEAGQEPFADQHVAMSCVIAMPILVESQQDGHATTIGGTSSISFCRS